ncbi:MAG: phenylalanine 4-monooxygenase [Cytophagales bacterium]
MKQHYEKYSKEDFEVWKILFERQKKELSLKAGKEYNHYLNELNKSLNADFIPRFPDLNNALMEKTNWSIEVVPGLIPVERFFELLSKRKFCSSTWIRKKSQLDYLEEPDMFHDIFGHIPLLMDSEYANYMQALGQLGVHYKDHPEVIMGLRSLYWFTIEFGLMGSRDNPQIYGAGIISSYGESKHIYENKNVTVKQFDLDEILEKEIVTSEIQNLYYSVESMSNLYDTLDSLKISLEKLSSKSKYVN